MVAGRKQQTVLINGNAPFNLKAANNVATTRNLSKSQLGGVIFGCTKNTYNECLFKQLFGLPGLHFSYVKNIDPGLPLFLFNYSERKLYGIFEAASRGQMNINPYGWTADGSEKTQYPAQVQIRVRQQCQPLVEEQFRPIIADNYYNRNHFRFELDHVQTSKLMSLFTSLAISPRTYLPHNTAKWRNVFHTLPSSGTKREDEGLRSIASEMEHANQASEWDTNIFFDELKVADDGKLSAPEVEHFSQSSGKSDATDFASFDPLETNVDVKTIEQGEKDVILVKLKELALKRKAQDVSSIDKVEDSTVMKDAKFKVGVSSEQMDLVQKEDGACSSSQCQSSMAQLKQELEELRTFKVEQSEVMIQMEQRLVALEREIQRLKDGCLMLESSSNQSVEHVNVKETETEPSEELQLYPTKSIFLVGGFNGESWSSAMDSYLPSHDVIKSVQPMSSVRAYASVAQLNGEFYVFGGGDGGGSWYNTVELYNPSSDRWTVCPSLKQQKGSLAGAALGGKIFSIGGGNGIECFSDVEMLDLVAGRWINVRSMLQKRFALASVELNGAIYATGGYDGQEYLNSAERFDPREHSWTKIACMSTKRGCHSLVVLNEKIYAIGGYDGTEMVPSVEIFDPRMDSWMNGAPINQPRGYGAAAVVEGSIYVIGGLRAGNSIVDSVESFKDGEGWQVTTSKTVGKRCFLSAIVVNS